MMRCAQTYKCEKCTVQSGAYEECTHTDWCRDGAYLRNVHIVHLVHRWCTFWWLTAVTEALTTFPNDR